VRVPRLPDHRVDKASLAHDRALPRVLAAQDAMAEELTPAQVMQADILALPPAGLAPRGGLLEFTCCSIAPERRLELLSAIHQAHFPRRAIPRKSCNSPIPIIPADSETMH